MTEGENILTRADAPSQEPSPLFKGMKGQVRDLCHFYKEDPRALVRFPLVFYLWPKFNGMPVDQVDAVINASLLQATQKVFTVFEQKKKTT